MKLIANYYLALFVCFFNLIAFSNNSSNKNFNTNMNMQRVRIDFESPNGYVRPLLLGFTPDNTATDGVDYGYDGANFDQFPDDLFWLIENESYVIQGVGEFDVTKQYPLALFLENSGTISISLNSLENFEDNIDVFIYDSLLDTYELISESDFSIDMETGEYLNRFYIAFMDQNTFDDENSEENTSLTTNDYTIKNTTIQYYSSTQEIKVNLSNEATNIDQIITHNINGQYLNTYGVHPNAKEHSIKLQHQNINYVIVEVKTKSSSYRKLLAVNY